MIVDTIKFYILILVIETLALIQGHKSVGKQNVLHQSSHKVFIWFEWIDLDGNWYAVETC